MYLRKSAGGQQDNTQPGQASSNTLSTISSSIKATTGKIFGSFKRPDKNSSLPLHAVNSTRIMPRDQELLYILLCMKHETPGTSLHQKRVEQFNTDRELFIFLQSQYLKIRKGTAWLTLRSIKGMSLCRVRSFAPFKYL